MKITVAKHNIGEKMKKKKKNEDNKDNIRNLWDNIKCTNIHIIGIPERREREKGTEKIFEKIISKNFHNMIKEIVNKDQEVQRVPGRKNSRRTTSRHIVVNLTKIKDKDKILKETRKKDNIQRNSHKIIS